MAPTRGWWPRRHRGEAGRRMGIGQPESWKWPENKPSVAVDSVRAGRPRARQHRLEDRRLPANLRLPKCSLLFRAAAELRSKFDDAEPYGWY